MEEIRIDCLHQSAEDLAKAKELRQNIFRLNHTMPDTEEYTELLQKVFPHLGENCRIETPFSGVRTANVKFGSNVIIMPGCLMMSAGGITIDDNVQIAANVQLITYIQQPRFGESLDNHLQTHTYPAWCMDWCRSHHLAGNNHR